MRYAIADPNLSYLTTLRTASSRTKRPNCMEPPLCIHVFHYLTQCVQGLFAYAHNFCVLARHAKYSSGVRNGCSVTGFSAERQSGVQATSPFAFCSSLGRSDGQRAFLLIEKLKTLDTPCLSMHFCMKRSSP